MLLWLKFAEQISSPDGLTACAIFKRPSRECTGNFFIDDEVLAEAGVTDLSPYRYGDASEDDLATDLFLD